MGPFAAEKIDEEWVYNSDMVFYHLKNLVAKGRPPKSMVDVNVSTDYDKLETIVDIQLHLILFQFRGKEVVRLEKIA